ncbi:P-loop containing nucleoside triphosphate hydrolase protein [Rhizodiscina lignyota]|uniref:ATP-dependent RNA helicase n=1 Tax=Rhizodiscina lignyota TaxID=1504668 RepID=A0A9P4I8K4_9PEZI|nr:P-loop containing nucleoside triphosphate hydrolase protein [Rhizodiscina lignyota]
MSEAVYDTKTLKESRAPTFQSLGGKLQAPLLHALDDMGYEFMTPVQQQVLAALPSSSGEFLVQAKTGTGKTIAFLLPALQELLTTKPVPKRQVAILILSPTRELALQIAKECDQLTARLPQPVECHTAIGGTTRASNLSKFMNGNPTVLVATPGRLNDYVGEDKVRAKFANLRTLILDEADRMLDQGFIDDIKRMLKSLPPKSEGWKGMCFSATLPPKVQDVIAHVLNPGYTRLSTIAANELPTVASVPQYAVPIPNIHDTFTTLFALLQRECAANPTNFKTIVFGTTANGVALLYSLFGKLAPTLLPGLKVYQLHSRLSQNIRTRTTEEFKDATSGLMFASDVIGRGMDFPNVGLVVQLGLPADAEQYIHRVGRTARAGNTGRAVILLTTAEAFFLTVNKHLPVDPYPEDVATSAAACRPQVEAALDEVDFNTRAKAYQAFLGFHKTFVKKLRTDNVGLVAMANEYSKAMQCPAPPPLDKKIVGKMGLKGVKGLVYAVAQPQGPSRGSANDTVSKGKRARTSNVTDGVDAKLSSASERNPKRGGTLDREESNHPARRGQGRNRRGRGATEGRMA